MPKSKEAIEISYHAFHQNPDSFRADLAIILPGWELLPVESWRKPEDWVRYLSRTIPQNKLSIDLNPPRNTDHAGLVVFRSGPPVETAISIKGVTRVQIRLDLELPQLRFINEAGALLLVSRIAQGGIAVSPSEAPNWRESQTTSTSIRIQYS